MAKNKLKTFIVGANVHVSTNREVQAESLEKALEIARGFTVHDFVTMAGDHNDSRFDIDGVFQSDSSL